MKNTKDAFELNEAIYATTGKGYYYRTVGTDMRRISRADYELAWDELIASVNAADEDLEWEQEVTAPKKAAAKRAERSDKAAEDKLAMPFKVVKEKKAEGTKRTRQSKDIAWAGVVDDGIVAPHTVTLTSKQVDFIKHIPDTCFYENGLDSTPWCDVLADEIGGQFTDKPMTVGAMISTLREKGVIYVGTDRINGKKAKYFGFTEVGKRVAKELGLE